MNKLINQLLTFLLVSFLFASCNSGNSNDTSDNSHTAFVPDPNEIVRTGNGKEGWSFETTTGVKLFEGRKFKMASEFMYGYSTVQIEKDGKRLYGVINHKGEEVIPITSEDRIGLPAEGGYFAIFKNGKVGLMNKDHKMTIPAKYKAISSTGLGHNQVFVQEENGLWGTVNINTGKTIVEFKHANPGTKWNCGRSQVETEPGKFIFIDPKGNTIHDGYFSRAFWFVEPFDLAMVQKDGKYGFINKNGKVAIDFDYADYKMVEEYRADDVLLKDGTNKRYILEEGYIILKKGNKWGYLDVKGEVVVPFEFDDVGIVRKGSTRIGIVKDNQQGVYDISTQTLTMN